jgi:hypothetical protein
MRLWVLVVSVFATVCLAAMPARAQEAPLESELSCLVVSLGMMQSGDPQLSNSGRMAFLYWLGRIDGGDPALDLETRLPATFGAMTQEKLAQEAMRCGGEMIERGNEVQAIGRRLQSRGL